jgi:hypothetical protein
MMQASDHAREPIQWDFPQIAMHAGPNSVIDGYSRRQPYFMKARLISYPSTGASREPELFLITTMGE